MKIKPIAIILITLIFLTGLRLVWLVVHSPPEQPLVENGVLDLTDFELPSEKLLTLNGEWAFTAGQLIELAQENELQDKAFVQVPGNSDNQKSARYGTYETTIQLPHDVDEGTHWGLKLPPISTAYALYINDRLVDASGNVASNEKDHVGTGFSTITYFSTNERKIDIRLLVSNFDTNDGIAISKSIHFGDAAVVDSAHDMNQILVTSLVAILLLFSVFSILVYFFIYKKKIVLLFTLGFMLPAIDELTTINNNLLSYLPLNYEWTTKFLNLVYLGAAFFFIQFMRLLLARFRTSKLFTYYSWLYVLCAILIVVLPVSALTEADTSFFILYALSFLSVVVLALREFISAEKKSIFIALTALATTSGIVWGAIKGTLSLEIPFYPFDYLIGFICFAAFWFNHFFQLKKESDEYVIKLQQIDKRKDVFLEESAEKLWGPINEMITIGQTVYDTEQALTLQNKKNIKYFIDIGRSLSFTLNDLMTFTQLKEKEFVLERENLRIQTFIPGIFDMLVFMTDAKKIKMTSSISEDFPMIYADEKRIIQILFNILHNAVKYTPTGEITIRAIKKGTFAQFEVIDTGIGIEQKALSKVVQPFVRLQKNNKGIGIGLTVSQQLVKLHGGTLEISSSTHKGTTIRFSIPFAKSNEEQNPEKQVHSSPVKEQEEAKQVTYTTKPYTTLVIDHDLINLVVIENILTSNENHIVCVNNLEDALRLLEEPKWDLVIIDAMMPIQSGYSFTQVIRKQYSKLELPILLLTTRNYPVDVYTALALGANDYVTKPINALELKTRAHTLIDLKKSINDRLQMETALLQAQIQPHFLFNTLNSISALSLIDQERMIDLLNHFGKYLQSSFDIDNLNPAIPIQKELELVKSYLYIQQERFQHRLTVEWDLTDHLSFELPPLLLQTLVENAIHHGLLKKAEGGKLTITIEEKAGFFFIQIADDGVGMTEDQMKTLLQDAPHATEGIGLSNTNRRLLEFFNEKLHIESKVGEGTIISFKIPK